MASNEENVDTVFDDEVGKSAFRAFQQLESKWSTLQNNLESQFNDSQDDDDEEEEMNSSRRYSEGNDNDNDFASEDAEQMEQLIRTLNRHEEAKGSEEYSTSSGEREDNTESGADDNDDAEFEDYHRNLEFDEAKNEDNAFAHKVLSLVHTLQDRAVERESNPMMDEWDNDDDSGYVTITLSAQEYLDFEESNGYQELLDAAAERERQSILKRKRNSAQTKEREQAREKDRIQDDALAEILLADGQFAYSAQQEKFQHNRRQSVNEQRRAEIIGQHRFQGADGPHCFFQLKVIFEPFRTGFEESKDLRHPKGTILAGRYEVYDVLGSAAFSTALQCVDLAADESEGESRWVCLKVIKNNKDFFDQSLDEIKLLQLLNSHADPDSVHVLRLIDFFYCKEHLFIVSELLKENLYEFGRYIRENELEHYYTLPRLKKIAKQVLEALAFVHSHKLIHCDVKPENIVIKSFSRCEVKLIDFGSSCFTTDHLTTYIQSRSYRAPEVILGHPYDSRIDVWSVGCVLAELFTNYVLFQNDSVATMLARITGILGPFPAHVLQRGRESGKYFTSTHTVYEKDDDRNVHLIFPKHTNLESRLHLQHLHESAPANECDPDPYAEERQFVDFIRSQLLLDPVDRVTAREALRHPWLANADDVHVPEYVFAQQTASSYPAQTEVDNEPVPPNDEEEEDFVVENSLDMSVCEGHQLDDNEYDDTARADNDVDASNNNEVDFEKSTMLDESNAITLDDDLAAFEAENS